MQRVRTVVVACLVGLLLGLLPAHAAPADGAETGRLAGGDRYATAVAIADRAFPDGADRVYLARADDFPDALAAGALTDGPILLVPSVGDAPDVVARKIDDFDPADVIALGGPAAVSTATLEDAADGRPSGRLAGGDRYATAVAIADEAFPNGADRVYLARADDFPDALAAGALTDGPILLVPSSGQPPASVRQAVDRLDPAMVMALGGTGAVANATLEAAAAGRDTGRLAGGDRYATAVEIARAAFTGLLDRVYVARADNFPDALAAGALTDGPILLVPSCGSVPSPVADLIATVQALEVVALGGTAAVCDETLESAAIHGATGPVELSKDTAVASSRCWYDSTGVESNARTYARALTMGDADPYWSCGGHDGSIQFDLSRDYDRLLATFGLVDTSPIDNEWQFDVFLDGVNVLTERVGFGEEAHIDVDTSDALRLRIDATLIAGDDPVGIMVGNPRVLTSNARDADRYESYRSVAPADEYFLTDYGDDYQVPRDTSSCWYESAGLRIDGETYARPLSFGDGDPYWSCGSHTGTIGYDVERAFSRFVAVAGVGDHSPPETSARFDVVGDGQVLATETVGFGEAADFDVDISGVLRLQLVVDVSPDGIDAAHAGFGDPKLHK